MNTEKIWLSFLADLDGCEDCVYLKETRDMYATGDSPTELSCGLEFSGLDKINCWRVERYARQEEV